MYILQSGSPYSLVPSTNHGGMCFLHLVTWLCAKKEGGHDDELRLTRASRLLAKRGYFVYYDYYIWFHVVLICIYLHIPPNQRIHASTFRSLYIHCEVFDYTTIVTSQLTGLTSVTWLWSSCVSHLHNTCSIYKIKLEIPN